MTPSKCFHIGHEHLHMRWSQDVPPVLAVNQNEVVKFDLMESTGGQLTPSSTTADILSLDITKCDPVFGPVYINGAEPGDVLEVEFMDLETSDWGFTCIIPGFGLLEDEFPDPVLKHWKLLPEQKATGAVEFKEGINVPLHPFLGCCGVAPSEKGEFSTIPPLKSGGNLDCRYLTSGTKLFLPVSVSGALFSCGDGHAAQGDGEVCGTAIETPMKATIRFRVHKDKAYIKTPHFDTSGSFARGTARVVQSGAYASIGINESLKEASRDAVKGLIAYLGVEKGLTKEEAYMLTSVAADLKILEAVNMSNYAVAASLPFSIFKD